MNTLAFTLLEATLTLYAQRADGSLGGVIWSGAAIENFTTRKNGSRSKRGRRAGVIRRSIRWWRSIN